ncbi:MAG TPA: asparagine synthase (glutamine-hydrolyzing) [Longimicrobiaceae bacterium]|nr:asparagine synthase (glutamine-hydrolyzing) [Longimicrobiaceae bacterium]
MCGVAGWLRAGTAPPEETRCAVQRMTECLAHRGPDDAGVYQDGPVVLGHRRLSILDLSDAGHQPMRGADGRYVMVYNGEVYNFRALADELRALGCTFHSGSDTEVILAAFGAWGHAALERFDGMFALALWDTAARELLLARDRAGIKPLYFALDERGLVFASEVKAVQVARGGGPARPDASAVADVVLVGSLFGTRTMLEGVDALRAGEMLVCGADGRQRERRFFHTLAEDVRPERYAASDRMSDRAHVDHLDALLQRSVQMHLASDAPVGVLCSGGVDSSLLTAMTHRLHPSVKIFHATYDGPGNEEAYARQVAEHLGCEIIYARMTREYYLGKMVRAVWHLDLPSYHPNDISLYSVCELAHEHGCKVLVSGEGADELFGGYSWHRDSLRSFRRTAAVRRLSALPRRARSGFQRVADGMAELFPFSPEGLWHVTAPQSNQRMLAQAAQGVVGTGGRWAAWRGALERYGFVADEGERHTLAHIFSNTAGHLDSILWRTDRLGMMTAVENRVPILENEIMEYGVNLPLRFKIRGREGKWVLKKVAERYLPHEVIYRPKAGFPVPWWSYLPQRTPGMWEGGFVAEHFGMSPAMIEEWVEGMPLLRWRLTNLEIWGRLFARALPLAEVEAWFAGAVGA